MARRRAGRPVYHPPRLHERVWLRYPGDRPAGIADRYGRRPEPTLADGWGVEVHAAMRELGAQTLYENGFAVYVQVVVWTIRDRAGGVAPNAEIVHAGKVYRSIGPALHRGGPGTALRAKYLEIYCELRQ